MNLQLIQDELLSNIYNIEIDFLSEIHVTSLSELLYMHLDKDYLDEHLPDDFKVDVEWDDTPQGHAHVHDHYTVQHVEEDSEEIFREVERRSDEMPMWNISIIQHGSHSKAFINCPDTTFPVSFTKYVIGWCLMHDLPYEVKYSNPDKF